MWDKASITLTIDEVMPKIIYFLNRKQALRGQGRDARGKKRTSNCKSGPSISSTRSCLYSILSCDVSYSYSNCYKSVEYLSWQSDQGGAFRGFLWAAIIASILIVVAIYGAAVLLNVQWLRLVGIYGLFCIFAEGWLMLFTWLSTSPANWTLFSNPNIMTTIYFVCIFIATGAFLGWQKRYGIPVERLTYLIGITSSFNLFLVFGFLISFTIYNLTGALILQFGGFLCIFLAQIFLWAIIRSHDFWLLWKVKKTSIIGFLVSETSASVILFAPISFWLSMSQPFWIFLVLAIPSIGVLLLFTAGIISSIVHAEKSFH